MDIFVYEPTSDLVFDNGKVINSIRSKTWIERYRASGEFTFIGPVDSGIRDELPIGSFVSHVDTREVMIIENHEISENRGESTDAVITGRSLESFLEQRTIGSDRSSWPAPSPPPEFTLPADYTWNQAEELIREHVNEAQLADDDNALLNVIVDETVGGTGPYEARILKRGPVYAELLTLLAIDDLGIRSIRMNPVGFAEQRCTLVIHRGVDRTKDVIFAYDTGEIETADYLWSNKSDKNCVLITGRWLETAVVDGAKAGFDRRWMNIDATDLDNSYSAAPTGATRTAILNAMLARGNQALADQNQTSLIKADAIQDAKRFLFRIDFELGDIVTVQGQYGESAHMRVTEYVETEDETGEHGQPTFAAL